MTPEQYYARLIPFAKREAHHGDGLEWGDLLHDALLGAFRNRPTTDWQPPIPYVYGWIRGLARKHRTHQWRSRAGYSLDWEMHDGDGEITTRAMLLPDPDWEPENVGLRWTQRHRNRLRQLQRAVQRESESPSRTRGWREAAKARMRARHGYPPT